MGGKAAADAARARFEVAQQRHKEARARASRRTPASRRPPVAILMLSKSATAPLNLAVWAKWLHETGRKGSKIIIHGKHPWQAVAGDEVARHHSHARADGGGDRVGPREPGRGVDAHARAGHEGLGVDGRLLALHARLRGHGAAQAPGRHRRRGRVAPGGHGPQHQPHAEHRHARRARGVGGQQAGRGQLVEGHLRPQLAHPPTAT